MRPSRLLLAFVPVAAIAACGTADGAGTVAPRAPHRAWYEPPSPLPAAPPGTLIRAQRVDLPLNPPATVWRILYHSRSLSGRDIAVSGFAIVPAAATSGDVRQVFAWAHGSMGQADRCAPSRHLRENLPPYGGQLIAHGVALVATDYEGLGTPGEPTTYVGIAEGHAVLDSIRALRALPSVGKLGPVVLAGHSQGGGAALWAAQLARTYAPDLNVHGVLALAPAAQFATILRALHHPPFNGTLGETLWAIDGLKAAYGNRIELHTLLTPAAFADLPRVAHECAAQTIARWQGKPLSAVFARAPLSFPSLDRLLNQNLPGTTNPGIPIMLAQGDQDQQIPVGVTAQLQARYCRLGATVTRRVYPGVDHAGVIDAAQNDVLRWLGDRLVGKPSHSDC
jgi:pimeloyl-ACP methyl ester carboxylesterase